MDTCFADLTEISSNAKKNPATEALFQKAYTNAKLKLDQYKGRDRTPLHNDKKAPSSSSSPSSTSTSTNDSIDDDETTNQTEKIKVHLI